MPLREQQCTKCGEKRLVFDDENKPSGDCRSMVSHNFVMLPPQPVVVHSTETFMSTEVRLDSHYTIYELDRVLSIEARDEEEMKIFQQARINS
jgi:hypothetical protein